jgi:hypothetical protein
MESIQISLEDKPLTIPFINANQHGRDQSSPFPHNQPVGRGKEAHSPALSLQPEIITLRSGKALRTANPTTRPRGRPRLDPARDTRSEVGLINHTFRSRTSTFKTEKKIPAS